jgi:hypothetical protein
MNARTIRRAIERKAEKQARKELKVALATERESPLADYEATKATLQQLQANRRNAQLSTGPRTEEGKSISSRNALKTGLTGRAVLLPNDDAALYEHHVASFFAELKPIGDREIELTQSIADSKWRLARIPSLEFGIYALGRLEFAEEFSNHPPAEAAALIEAKTFVAYQRQLNNLSIQESRLRRQCEKDTAELNRLQELRAQTERAKAKAAASTPKSQPLPNHIGFEFSNPAIHPLETDHDLEFDRLTQPQAA